MWGPSSAAARPDDPWPYAFSTLCASIGEGRYGQVSKDFTPLRAENQRAFEISFFE
jgi:NAD(P)H dehydrogenase (quinone)